jgi:hypothetical protein
MPLQLSPRPRLAPGPGDADARRDRGLLPVSSASSSTLILPPPPVPGCFRRLRREFCSPHSPCPPHHPRLFSAPRSTPALAQRPSPHPLPRPRRLPFWPRPRRHRRLLSPSWGRGKRRRKKSQAFKPARPLASHQNPPETSSTGRWRWSPAPPHRPFRRVVALCLHPHSSLASQSLPPAMHPWIHFSCDAPDRQARRASEPPP